MAAVKIHGRFLRSAEKLAQISAKLRKTRKLKTRVERFFYQRSTGFGKAMQNCVNR
jgi:hypothetical protein